MVTCTLALTQHPDTLYGICGFILTAYFGGEKKINKIWRGLFVSPKMFIFNALQLKISVHF